MLIFKSREHAESLNYAAANIFITFFTNCPLLYTNLFLFEVVFIPVQTSAI